MHDSESDPIIDFTVLKLNLELHVYCQNKASGFQKLQNKTKQKPNFGCIF